LKVSQTKKSLHFQESLVQHFKQDHLCSLQLLFWQEASYQCKV